MEVQTQKETHSASGNFEHLTEGYVRNNPVRLRLAILGAPGAGKSTLSAGLLYFAKLFQFQVDLVPEVAKWHFYKGTDFKDPQFEFRKYDEQKELEEIYPKDLEILISEAPLLISAVYSAYYMGDDHPVAQELFRRAEKEKDRYTHYILSRKLVKFEKFGRNETEEQAEELHQKTIEVLEHLGLNYIVINRYDRHIPLHVLEMVGAVRKQNS